MRVWLLGCDALDPRHILLGLVPFPREVVTSSPCPTDSSAADGVPCETMGAARAKERTELGVGPVSSAV